MNQYFVAFSSNLTQIRDSFWYQVWTLSGKFLTSKSYASVNVQYNKSMNLLIWHVSGQVSVFVECRIPALQIPKIFPIVLGNEYGEVILIGCVTMVFYVKFYVYLSLPNVTFLQFVLFFLFFFFFLPFFFLWYFFYFWYKFIRRLP